MTCSTEKVRVLFVYSILSPFIRRDLEILERNFDVKKLKIVTFLVPGRDKGLSVFMTLFRHIMLSDLVYAWWADLNAFFIVLFCLFLRKKVAIVVGGYEVAYVPKINYGRLLSLSGRLEVKFILKHASETLAVSKASEKEILRFTKPKKLFLAYNGVDTEEFKQLGAKQNIVLTVGTVSDSTIEIKGFDTFVKAARYLPDTQFILIGEYDDSIKRIRENAGRNVMFKKHLSDKRLIKYYQKSKVYCQLSKRESFGVALAEAMACCCVPVVTRTHAIPEVVGDTGFYVPYHDPVATAEAIKKALESSKGIKARERIQKCFSLEAREKILVKEILDMIRNSLF